MKLNLYEKMDIMHNCTDKHIDFAQDSNLYDTNGNDNNIANTFSQSTNKENLVQQCEVLSSNAKSDPRSEESLENNEAIPCTFQAVNDGSVEINNDFFTSNVQNVINIPESHIVKIAYQNEDGVVNTEYIVNEDLLNTHLGIETNYLDINQDIEESLYEEQVVTDDSEHLFHTKADVCGEPMLEVQQEVIFRNKELLDYTVEGEESSVSENALQSFGSTSMLSPQSEDDVVTETDLKSLNWLHNITNIMSVPNLPTPPVSPKPKRKSQNTSQEDLTININYYKRNGEKKPPFSYATLICMAMGKNGNKMTLSDIYHWIRENFLHYRKAHPSWQVS